MKKKYILLLLLAFVNIAYSQVTAVRDYIYFDGPVVANQVLAYNVLDNDYLNNVPVTLSSVTLTQTSTDPMFELLPDGSVKALQNMPNGGGGFFYYEICDIANPNNCSTNFVFIGIDSLGDTISAACDVEIIVPPSCNFRFATVRLSNFPANPSEPYIVYLISNDNLFFGETFTSGEPIIVENVPIGEFAFGVENLDGLRFSLGGLYIPEPACDFHFTFEGALVDTDASGTTTIGDAIHYSFTVNNSGTVPVDNISITSATLNVVGGPLAVVSPGGSDTTTFTAEHVLTQQDINNNRIDHLAQVNGTAGAENVFDLHNYTTFLAAPDGIRFAVFGDTNNNGVMDGSETYLSYNGVGTFDYEINNDGNIHHVSVSNTTFTLYESNPITIYDLTFTLYPNYAPYYQITNTYTTNVASGSGITTYLFAMISVPYTDLNIRLIGGGVRPGTATQQKIIYQNNGTAAIASGTITYANNSLLTITNVSQTVTSTPTGFNFTFSNLQPGESRQIIIALQAPIIPIINIGDQLVSSVFGTVNSTSDAVLTNNQSSLLQTVSNAYDPNDINENHGPEILHSAFTSSDFLTYTIRFENTGNADALNIKVTDVLDDQLDENTVHMIAASHNYVLDRTGQTLNWTFNDIRLAPSVEDTNIGKGYIIFEVKPKAGYAVGDIIPNKADIYFDTNPAIETNIFNTEFVSVLGTGTFDFASIALYPNPVNSILNIDSKSNIDRVLVNNTLGQTVMDKTINGLSAKIDFTPFSKGIYFVTVQSGNQGKTYKVIRQ